MANLSNRNTSNSNTSSNATTVNNTPLFKVGDTVLCTMTGERLKSYVLSTDPHKQNNLLALTDTESVYYFDSKGFFVRASDTETQDFTPSIFHDTPANRQAIATLYQYESDVKVIDITQTDDDEVVKVPSVLLSDMACDAVTALETFNDIATLLYMIFNSDLDHHQLNVMARFAYDTANNRADTQLYIINKLNKPLVHSKFGIVEVNE